MPFFDGYTQLSGKLFGQVSDNTDINSIRTAGIYYGSFANLPFSHSTYAMVMVCPLPSWNFTVQWLIGQIWNTNVVIYTRTSTSTGWNAWKMLHQTT